MFGFFKMVNSAAKEVVEDIKEEIRDVNRDMRDLAKKTEEKVEKTIGNHASAVKKLNDKRKAIYATTITNFVNVASKIKNIDFENTMKQLPEFNVVSMQRLSYDTAPTSTWISKVNSVCIPDFSTVGVVIGSCFSYVSLSYKLDEAEAEYSKLKAKCAVIRTECTKLSSITKLYDSTRDTIEALAKLTDPVIARLGDIISEKGTDYRCYLPAEQEQVWLAFNMVAAMDKILNSQIVNEEGNVKSSFRKFIGEVEEKYLEVKHGGE